MAEPVRRRNVRAFEVVSKSDDTRSERWELVGLLEKYGGKYDFCQGLLL